MKPSVTFKNLGYAYLQNLLTPDECQKITDIMLEKKADNTLLDEKTLTTAYKNSYGGNHPFFMEKLQELTPRMETELRQIKMVPNNAYCRIYYDGSILNPHTDRLGLDYTLSISVFTNLNRIWPLYCTDLNGNNVALDIHVGDGGMIYGRTMEHWRDPMVCDPDQYVIQLFLHWTFPSEPPETHTNT